MEKKKSAVSSTYIPDDIVFFILSKLPLKSFKRFESVRKSWSLLSENTHFMNMFRNNILSNSYCPRAPLLLSVFENNNEVLYSFSGEKFENKVKLDLLNPFEYDSHFSIFGSVIISGTLCIHKYDKIVLWNPSTQTINLLPPSDVELAVSSIPDEAKDFVYVKHRLHGFGYDHVINDYKVIRFLQVWKESLSEYSGVDWLGEINLGPIWEIYSLRSNLWRELYVDMPPSLDWREGTKVYMDGSCHWLCQDSLAGPCLVSFCLSNEVSSITPIPPDVDDCFDVEALWVNLAVLNGYITLISYLENTTTFRISILGEPGLKESWIKFLIVGPLPCVEYPIGLGTNGEILFLRKDREVAWFDLSTQIVEELGYKTECCIFKVVNYKESVL